VGVSYKDSSTKSDEAGGWLDPRGEDSRLINCCAVLWKPASSTCEWEDGREWWVLVHSTARGVDSDSSPKEMREDGW